MMTTVWDDKSWLWCPDCSWPAGSSRPAWRRAWWRWRGGPWRGPGLPSLSSPRHSSRWAGECFHSPDRQPPGTEPQPPPLVGVPGRPPSHCQVRWESAQPDSSPPPPPLPRPPASCPCWLWGNTWSRGSSSSSRAGGWWRSSSSSVPGQLEKFLG